MEININDERKCAKVSLTASEQDNPNVWRNLQPMMDEYREKDYLFIICESQEDDINNVDITS